MIDSLQTIDDLLLQESVRFSLLDILTQAGGFQWPILGALVAGLTVLALRVVGLAFDRHASVRLRTASLAGTSPNDLETLLDGSGESLHAQLLRAMLAWRSVSGATLIEETQPLLNAARSAYARTQRMVNYCSSAAGGLGLLGTLVGIYVLFGTGTRDPQTIFAGIALAVVSTLLGIVASIILELLEAVAHGWVSRYLDGAESWAGRVRHSLLSKCEAH